MGNLKIVKAEAITVNAVNAVNQKRFSEINGALRLTSIESLKT